ETWAARRKRMRNSSCSGRREAASSLWSGLREWPWCGNSCAVPAPETARRRKRFPKNAGRAARNETASDRRRPTEKRGVDDRPQVDYPAEVEPPEEACEEEHEQGLEHPPLQQLTEPRD